LGDKFDGVSHLLYQQGRSVLVQDLIDGRHDAHLEQYLDDFRGLDGHLLGQVRDGVCFADGDFTGNKLSRLLEAMLLRTARLLATAATTTGAIGIIAVLEHKVVRRACLALARRGLVLLAEGALLIVLLVFLRRFSCFTASGRGMLARSRFCFCSTCGSRRLDWFSFGRFDLDRGRLVSGGLRLLRHRLILGNHYGLWLRSEFRIDCFHLLLDRCHFFLLWLQLAALDVGALLANLHGHSLAATMTGSGLQCFYGLALE